MTGPKSSMGSLKINDYKNNKGTQTKSKTGVKECQTDTVQEKVVQVVGPESKLYLSQEVLDEIDCLGASLDSKITLMVQVLVSMKE
jgi:hypothetical protein